MSTNDVPGANPANRDVLATGCWAEHDDGSLIFVEANEAGRVIYSIFDVSQDPPVEYRDAMPEAGFKVQFTWKPDDGLARGNTPKVQLSGTDIKPGQDVIAPNLRWIWHDKNPFPWDRVMRNFPSGQRRVSVDDELNAAQRVAQSLQLRAGAVRENVAGRPTLQRAATTIMRGIREAIDALDR